MRVIPLSFAPFLSESEVFHHECSDRIWVPRAMFERWLTAEDAGTVVIVRLDDIPACMYAPHREGRNVIYAPTWMCEELGVSMEPPMSDEDSNGTRVVEDDYIVPERITPPMCTFMRVQPHTSAHLPDIVGGRSGEAMPEDTLSRAFEEYTCIREGQTLTMELPTGDRMFVTIVEAQPQGGPLCIRNTEIAMDLLEPLDAPATATATTTATAAPTADATVDATADATAIAYFTPAVHIPLPPPVADTVPETREERRARLANAAMARIATATAATTPTV